MGNRLLHYQLGGFDGCIEQRSHREFVALNNGSLAMLVILLVNS